MTKLFTLIPGLVLACLTLARAEDPPKFDVVMQKVLKQNGVDAKILKPYAALAETSPRKDGQFFFSFEGTPGIEVLLDRDYCVLATSNAKEETDVTGYMMNPKDGQSALNLSIGNGVPDDFVIAWNKEPGFSGFATGNGVIGGQRIMWRRWSDQNHLYSGCTLRMPPNKNGSPGYKVQIQITANTNERRSALEDCMATLNLLNPKH